MDSFLEGSKTLENLENAFYAEASLAFRYHFFSIIAQFEGMDRCATMFEDFSKGGKDNVHGCLDFLRLAKDPDSQIPFGNTAKNLQSLLQTEIQQFTEIYPEFARVARDEGFTDIASWFDTLEKLKRRRTEKLEKVTND